MSNATLSFLPWVREGAAASITAVDAPKTPTQPAVATVAAAVTVNGLTVPGVAVKLRGPVTSTGNDRAIVRTDPRPERTTSSRIVFRRQFDRPDFPWIFTGEGHADQSAPAVALLGGGAEAARRHVRRR